MTDADERVLSHADEPVPRVESARQRRHVLRWVLLAAVLVLLAVVAAGVWVGVHAIQAKDSLARAETLVGQLRTSITEDPSAAPRLAERLGRETAAARADTDGPLWRIGELLPVAGKNLAVVRRLAAAVDDVSVSAIGPLARAATSVSSLRPVGGAIDLATVQTLVDDVRTADGTLQRASTDVNAIDASGTVAEVSGARDRLSGLLGQAAATTDPVAKVMGVLVPLLGGDGPRNYILMFQNNAEARSLGGNPAALVLVGVDHGAIRIAQQAASGDFARRIGSPIEVDPHLYSVYYPAFTDYVMDITTRPDFPTAARLAQGYWQRQFGLRANAVLSFDPVALAALLRATGPVRMSTGDELTAANAVQLLLSDVYARYADPHLQDAFFAEAARSVFAALTAGRADPAKLFAAMAASASDGRFMAWSDRPEEQKVIEETPVSGVLPATNTDATTVGVYFMDQSSSKIDYWVQTTAAVAADRCGAGPAVFRARVGVASLLTQQQADALPPYVVSSWWGSRMFSTDVYVVGPPGTRYLDTVWGRSGIGQSVVSVGEDLGRPVVRLNTVLAPAGASEATVRFEGADPSYGPLAVRTTPMVKATKVSVEQSACR